MNKFLFPYILMTLTGCITMQDIVDFPSCRFSESSISRKTFTLERNRIGDAENCSVWPFRDEVTIRQQGQQHCLRLVFHENREYANIDVIVKSPESQVEFEMARKGSSQKVGECRDYYPSSIWRTVYEACPANLKRLLAGSPPQIEILRDRIGGDLKLARFEFGTDGKESASFLQNFAFPGKRACQVR